MTFKPKVSQKSVMLARQQRRPEGTTVFDMLIEEGKAVRKKKDELRERLEQERMQGCSFK